jgi:Zn-dependent peptidase ImmA (M78 family)/transcriptional regulator with XRE-family HTH domain
MMRVEIKPKLLHWASERNGRDVVSYSDRFPLIEKWLTGEVEPTLKQLERFAGATHTPIGYFFFEAPPIERIPIPDLRTVGNERLDRPSPNLLDTLYLCEQRQEWYRSFARTMGEPRLAFVGSRNLGDDVVETAADIRTTIGFDIDARAGMRTWTDALRHFIGQADAAGIMIMCSGVAKGNTHRALDPEEFRGFSMADDTAPLVFINGKDTKAAQMFTLAHELAHIWLGESGLSDIQANADPHLDIERWCNQVAAEVLVPLVRMKEVFNPDLELDKEVQSLARRFKVSVLVILRRLHDAGVLDRDAFHQAYNEEYSRLMALPKSSSGGNFYLTRAASVSKRFARAVIASTWEGHASFTEAFRLLGCRKMSTFKDFGHSLGMSF